MNDHKDIFDKQNEALKILMKGKPDYNVELVNFSRIYARCHTAKSDIQKDVVRSLLKHLTSGPKHMPPNSVYQKRCKIWAKLIALFVEDFDKELAA